VLGAWVPASEANLRKELTTATSCFFGGAWYRMYTTRSEGTAVESTVVRPELVDSLWLSCDIKVGSCMSTNRNGEFYKKLDRRTL
jgi:hypothetical protein